MYNYEQEFLPKQEKSLCYCEECEKYYTKTHCYDSNCRSDPHHMIYKTDNSETWCVKCKKCHTKLLSYCEICNECYLKNHCYAPDCKLDSHHTQGYKSRNKHEMCIQCNKCHELSLYSYLVNIC